MLYDDLCRVCTSLAKLGHQLSRGRIEILGHYAPEGRRFKSSFFREGDKPEEMFWLMVGDRGYGGRCGILPLIREVVKGMLA